VDESVLGSLMKWSPELSLANQLSFKFLVYRFLRSVTIFEHLELKSIMMFKISRFLRCHCTLFKEKYLLMKETYKVLSNKLITKHSHKI